MAQPPTLFDAAALERDRLTQPDWCNAPQPHNWRNACMRLDGHDGDHAVRKSYQFDEAFGWGSSGVVRSVWAETFPDLWPIEDEANG